MLAELNDGTVRTLFLVFLNLLNFHVELTLSFSLREMFLPYCAFLVVRSNYWSHDSLSYLTCTRFQSQVSCLPKKRGFFRFASAFSNCFDKTPSFSFLLSPSALYAKEPKFISLRIQLQFFKLTLIRVKVWIERVALLFRLVFSNQVSVSS